MAVLTISKNTSGAYIGDDTDMIDTQIKSNHPDTSYASDVTDGGRVEVTKYAVGDHTMALVRFDLSSIPAGATIDAVVLGMYISNINFNSTNALRRLLRDWTSDATWNNYASGSAWTTGGALSNGNDRSANVIESINIEVIEGWKVYSSAALVSDVQAMVDGDVDNFGWHLERTDGQDDAHYNVFISSEGADGSRPYLRVTYTEGAGSSISESSSALDSLSATTIGNSGVSEATSAVDTQSTSSVASGGLSEIAVAQDQISATIASVGSVLEDCTAQDSLTAEVSGAVGISEMCSAIDQVDGAFTSHASVFETAYFSDILGAETEGTNYLYESAVAVDHLSAIVSANASLVDSISLIDLIDGKIFIVPSIEFLGEYSGIFEEDIGTYLNIFEDSLV